MAIIARPSGGINTGDIWTTAQWNSEFDTIYNDYNGNIDSTNIFVGSITSDKLAAGSIAASAMASPWELPSTTSMCFLEASANISATANNDWAGTATGVFKRLTGATAQFTITGLTGGSDGRLIILYNSTAQNMVLANQSGSSAAANRIITCTGASVTTTGAGIMMLIYSATDSRWILLSSWG